MQKIVIDAGVWNHWHNVPDDELALKVYTPEDYLKQ